MAHWQSVLQTRLVAEIEESLFVLKVHSGNVTQTMFNPETIPFSTACGLLCSTEAVRIIAWTPLSQEWSADILTVY